MNLCTPALIYFVMAVASILVLVFSKVHATILMGQMVFVLAWTWLLNFVCKKGFTTVSWVLVMSPYVCMFMAFASGLIQIEEPKKDVKEPVVLI
jgi:hypothetical protein